MNIESIPSYLEHDLQRLKTLLDGFARLRRTNLVAAKACFQQFAQGLRRRIVWEEQIVFPVFERASGADGPTRVMRLEHQELSEVIESIDECLESGDRQTDALEEQLRETLACHDAEEEAMLYPTIESTATTADLDRISRAVAAFEAERNARSYL